MASVTRYIEKKYSDLIQNELTPQFLGLWIKMYKDGVPPDIAKRALAVALYNTTSQLRETRNLADDDEFVKMIEEIRLILVKYCDDGMHYGKLSAGLEFLVTFVLGTTSQEGENES